MSPSTKQPPTPPQGGLPPPEFCFALHTEINQACRILGKFPSYCRRRFIPLNLTPTGPTKNLMSLMF